MSRFLRFSDQLRSLPAVLLVALLAACQPADLNLATEAPTFDPPQGLTYVGDLTVTLSSQTPGAQIVYTLDGSDPRDDGIVYQDPLLITPADGEVFIRAYATAPNLLPSDEVQARFATSADPGLPSVPDLAAGSDTGLSSTDNITSGAILTFTGTALPGVNVRLFLGDGQEVGNDTADHDGNWSIIADLGSAAPAGAETPLELYAVAENAEVISPESGSLTILVDRLPPGALGFPSGAPAAGEITVSWTAPSDASQVEVATSPEPDGTPAILAPAASGAATVTGLQPETSYTVTLTTLDAAGNRGPTQDVAVQTLSYFPPGPGAALDTEALGADWVQTGDLDGDGDPDVLAVRPASASGQIAWYRNNLDQSADFSAANAIESGAVSASVAYPADVDGDGHTDVLAASFGDTFTDTNGRVVWYRNTDGDGTFGSAVELEARLPGATDLVPVDVNGDGAVDVVAVWAADFLASQPAQIVWYQNNGSGGFSTARAVGDMVRTPTVRAADLDGDGDPDILAAAEHPGSEDADRITWFENRISDGDGFVAKTDIGAAREGAEALAVADLDGDGGADVVAASFEDDRLVWYENQLDGAGAFAAAAALPGTPDGPTGVVATDIDGDADPDIVVSIGNGNQIVWIENRISDGGGFAVDAVINNSASSASSVHAADLDGDGDPDVLGTDSGIDFVDDRVAWYENRRAD